VATSSRASGHGRVPAARSSPRQARAAPGRPLARAILAIFSNLHDSTILGFHSAILSDGPGARACRDLGKKFSQEKAVGHQERAGSGWGSASGQR